MKKFLILLSFAFLSFSQNENLELYGKGEFKDENKNKSSEFLFGAQYKGLSLEAIYKKNLDIDTKDVKEYLKKGNTVGISLSYNFDGHEEKNEKEILIKNNDNIINKTNEEEIQVYYKLKNNDNLKNSLLDIKRISNLDKVSLNEHAQNVENIKVKKTIKVLRNISNNIDEKYGILNTKNIVGEQTVNKDKYILKFNENEDN